MHCYIIFSFVTAVYAVPFKLLHVRTADLDLVFRVRLARTDLHELRLLSRCVG